MRQQGFNCWTSEPSCTGELIEAGSTTNCKIIPEPKAVIVFERYLWILTYSL